MADGEGSVARPFQLGPFQNLISVHWGSKKGIILIVVTQHRENINVSFGMQIVPAFGEFSESTPRMPFIPAGAEDDKPPDLDLNEMLVLSGHLNPWEPTSGGGTDGGDTDIPTPPDWATLNFFNLKTLGNTSADGRKFEVDITFPAVPPTDPSTDTEFGYYIWLTGGGVPGTHAVSYVPRHPPPDASNAFLPYPFDDESGLLNYISLWNSIGDTWDPHTRDLYNAYGIPLPPLPSRGNLGWRSAAEAQQYCDAVLAFQNADIDNAIAIIIAGGGTAVRSDFQSPLEFAPLTIDFGPPDHPPPVKRYTADVRALFYETRVNFPYGETNGLDFPDPEGAENIATYSVDQEQGATIKTVKVTYDATNGMVIA